MGGMGSHIDELEIDDLADAIDFGLSIKQPTKDDVIKRVAKAIEKSSKIMVLSGAGVSVAAGIPDFRTPGTGLYDNLQKYNLPYPEAVFDVRFYQNNPRPFCSLARELWPGLTHSPTKTHSFLKLLADKNKLLRVFSQNIDGLEILAGIDPEKIVECHGHFRSASCTRCGSNAEIDCVQQTILEGNIPKCANCNGGYIKPDIVFFGESLPDRFHKLLKQDKNQADLLIVMGTSLNVAPVSMIPNMVSCNRILLNREKVLNIRHGKDHFVEGDCDDNVEKICDILHWKNDLIKKNNQTKINTNNNGNGDDFGGADATTTVTEEKDKERNSEKTKKMKDI